MNPVNEEMPAAIVDPVPGEIPDMRENPAMEEMPAAIVDPVPGEIPGMRGNAEDIFNMIFNDNDDRGDHV